MDELLDVLNETGEKTGETVLKSVARAEGIWCGGIHILIVNKDKTKTLLQKRSATVAMAPNTWDIAVGGHIAAGEDDLATAKRELEEELGIEVSDDDLIRVGKAKEQTNYGEFISHKISSIFILYADIDITKLKLQEAEVAEVRWFTYDELQELIDSGNIIPHARQHEMLKNILTEEK